MPIRIEVDEPEEMVSFRLPRSLKAAVEALCKEERITKTQFFVASIRGGLESYREGGLVKSSKPQAASKVG